MNWTLFLVLCGVGLVSYFGYFLLFKNQIMKLTKLLYQDNNAEGFLNELNSWQTKLFFPKKMQAMMKIDAYLMQGEVEKSKELFNELDKYRIRPGDEFYVRQKEVAFYVDLKDAKNSEKAYNRMREIYDSFKDKTSYDSVMKESEFIYEINIKKNYHYLEEMLERAKNAQADFSQGIYLYRAAKCYYFKGDMRLCKETLQRAQTRLKGTFYEAFIQDVLDKDIKLIEEK